MKMYLYDFDDTIYKGDSSVDFFLYSISKDILLIRYLPLQLIYAFLYLMGVVSKKKFKEKFFLFLKGIKEIDRYVEGFWSLNIKKIKPFYLEKKNENNIIISASPYFLLAPVIKSLEVNYLIATNVDKKTGLIDGENCYGEEKVKRLYKVFPEEKHIFEEMYTDSVSDEPLIKISKKGYLVKGDIITPYNYAVVKKNKIKELFFSKKFIIFIMVGVVNAFNGIFISSLISIYFDYMTAFILGYLISLSISYFLNSFITFKDYKLGITKYIKFCLSYIPNFMIQVISVFIFVDIFKVNKIYAYIFAVIIGIPITFMLLSLYAFKNKKVKK